VRFSSRKSSFKKVFTTETVLQDGEALGSGTQGEGRVDPGRLGRGAGTTPVSLMEAIEEALVLG
jgi:hypothetical protein